MSNSNINTKQTVLGRIITGTAELNDLALKDLTVLSAARDPYGAALTMPISSLA